MPDDFFDESREQSLVKATIVSKYFWAWARVIIPVAKRHSGRIAYIDVFAGPGRYRDGTKSTPLRILEQAIADPDMRGMLVAVFNDADEQNCRSLENAIAALPGIETLKHKPIIYNYIVNENFAELFEGGPIVPSLVFIDPWGYKGLSLRLINSVLKDWGCDCIFFFNYNRINMGLPNVAVDQHLDALFGEERARRLRERLDRLSASERELAIVEELAQALREKGGTYVLPFRFRNEQGTRTSHHLIFVSKHVKGYEIMKEIMAKESSSAAQGVPSFEYNPADVTYPLLFELSRPLDALEGMLLETFAGQSLTMREVYERHHVGRRYIKRNYKDALRKLEANDRIRTDPPAAKRKKKGGEVTFADSVHVNFPTGRR
jgi:three-Cys-motif partner protein